MVGRSRVLRRAARATLQQASTTLSQHLNSRCSGRDTLTAHYLPCLLAGPKRWLAKPLCFLKSTLGNQLMARDLAHQDLMSPPPFHPLYQLRLPAYSLGLAGMRCSPKPSAHWYTLTASIVFSSIDLSTMRAGCSVLTWLGGYALFPKTIAALVRTGRIHFIQLNMHASCQRTHSAWLVCAAPQSHHHACTAHSAPRCPRGP